MKFFKPEDFEAYYLMDPRANTTGALASMANAKLEKEAQVVYGNFGINGHNEITHPDRNPAHKALLLNIESVNLCKHPKEKIIYYDEYSQFWQCECGVNVEPLFFVEKKS
jgi:hypothetical protein